MAVTLSPEQQREFLERGHTGTVTTLKQDGSPVTLPVWYVVVDNAVYIRTPLRTKKVTRLRNDSRAWFLVESGLKWVELAAVGFPARGVILEPGPETDRVLEAFGAKYRDYGPPTQGLPAATERRYAAPAVIRLEQTGPAVSWDNSQIRMSRG
jgi:Pyridoxamine 5'-phosphate oxidase